MSIYETLEQTLNIFQDPVNRNVTFPRNKHNSKNMIDVKESTGFIFAFI